MNNSITQSLILFAQDKAPEGGGGSFLNFIPLILITLAFLYFMVFLPNKQRRKQQETLFNALKKNDKVETIGGIVGVISFIDEKSDEVTLRLEEGKLKILKKAIARVVTAEEQTTTDTNIKK